MYRLSSSTSLPALLLVTAAAVTAPAAHAVTTLVSFNVLNASATLPTPFLHNDVLRLDTYAGQSQTGPLLQTITFTVGAGVTNLFGEAAWEISTATGTAPRLTGVNIDIFNAADALVASDTFAGTLAGFALSTFSGAITPGVYRLVATGTAVRDASLDISIGFINAIPEPSAVALMLAGLGVIGFVTARRR